MVIIRNNADINTLTAPDRYFGNMIVAAPNWFTDEYLGIEIEQYIGFGLLAIHHNRSAFRSFETD